MSIRTAEFLSADANRQLEIAGLVLHQAWILNRLVADLPPEFGRQVEIVRDTLIRASRALADNAKAAIERGIREA